MGRADAERRPQASLKKPRPPLFRRSYSQSMRRPLACRASQSAHQIKCVVTFGVQPSSAETIDCQSNHCMNIVPSKLEPIKPPAEDDPCHATRRQEQHESINHSLILQVRVYGLALVDDIILTVQATKFGRLKRFSRSTVPFPYRR